MIVRCDTCMMEKILKSIEQLRSQKMNSERAVRVNERNQLTTAEQANLKTCVLLITFDLQL